AQHSDARGTGRAAMRARRAGATLLYSGGEGSFMPSLSSRSRRGARLSPSLAAALLVVCGCGAEPEDTAAAGLRLRFPDHADTVLSAREAFVPAADGFRLPATEPGGTWLRAARPEVELPRDGGGEIRFRRA